MMEPARGVATDARGARPASGHIPPPSIGRPKSKGSVSNSRIHGGANRFSHLAEERMRSFYIGDDLPVDGSAQPDLAVVALGGEVDYEVSPQLRTRIVRAIKDG